MLQPVVVLHDICKSHPGLAMKQVSKVRVTSKDEERFSKVVSEKQNKKICQDVIKIEQNRLNKQSDLVTEKVLGSRRNKTQDKISNKTTPFAVNEDQIVTPRVKNQNDTSLSLAEISFISADQCAANPCNGQSYSIPHRSSSVELVKQLQLLNIQESESEKQSAKNETNCNTSSISDLQTVPLSSREGNSMKFPLKQSQTNIISNMLDKQVTNGCRIGEALDNDAQFKHSSTPNNTGNCSATSAILLNGENNIEQVNMKHDGETANDIFPCSMCGESFSRFGLLVVHEAIHRRNNPFQHKCIICGLIFSSKEILIEHSQSHNITEKKASYSCKICLQSFQNYKLLAVHEKSHAVENEKNSIYKQLSKRDPKTLKSFKCDKCKHSFIRKKLLRVHKLKHHRNILSSRKFHRLLQEHERDLHSDENLNRKEPPACTRQPNVLARRNKKEKSDKEQLAIPQHVEIKKTVPVCSVLDHESTLVQSPIIIESSKECFEPKHTTRKCKSKNEVTVKQNNITPAENLMSKSCKNSNLQGHNTKRQSQREQIDKKTKPVLDPDIYKQESNKDLSTVKINRTTRSNSISANCGKSKNETENKTEVAIDKTNFESLQPGPMMNSAKKLCTAKAKTSVIISENIEKCAIEDKMPADSAQCDSKTSSDGNSVKSPSSATETEVDFIKICNNNVTPKPLQSSVVLSLHNAACVKKTYSDVRVVLTRLSSSFTEKETVSLKRVYNNESVGLLGESGIVDTTKKTVIKINSNAEIYKSKLVNEGKSELVQQICSSDNALQCNICKRVFRTNSNLTKHKKLHANSTFQCKFKNCDVLFTNYYQYIQHHNLHKKSSKYLNCKICISSFSTKAQLLKHKHSCSNVKYNCSSCSKVFQDKINLEKHVMVHTDKKAFPSSTPGKSCEEKLKKNSLFTKQFTTVFIREL